MRCRRRPGARSFASENFDHWPEVHLVRSAIAERLRQILLFGKRLAVSKIRLMQRQPE
jgi:hypothetical protein